MTKVLLIDDNAAILTFMAARLKSENVETLTADNGADGLRIAREHYPDVVVLDLMMPKMHGYTLIQEIRNDTYSARGRSIFEQTVRLAGVLENYRWPSGRNQITF